MTPEEYKRQYENEYLTQVGSMHFMRGTYTVIAGPDQNIVGIEGSKMSHHMLELADLVIDPAGRCIKNRWGNSFPLPTPPSPPKTIRKPGVYVSEPLTFVGTHRDVQAGFDKAIDFGCLIKDTTV